MGDAIAAAAAALSAQDSGRVCAVAGQVQRDLQRCAAGYAELFPTPPFDPAFFSTIALANTFCAPWLCAEEQRLTNRITLWVFALDRLIDHVATDASTVDAIVRGCTAVAHGGAPAAGDPLTALLAEIRDELATAPAYGPLGAVWRDELARVVTTMAREWAWKVAHAGDPGAALPTLDEYLDNAEFGYALVFVTHWIWTAGTRPIRDIDELRAAGWAVQRVIRLLNDLGTYHRDLRWGDLNALLVEPDRARVEQRLAAMTEQCREVLGPLADGEHRPLALFLARHIDFNTGFYRVTDYQAEP